jgi:putative ABC transport system ATP-binding protein
MLVQLENLEKAYGDGADRQRVLRGVSLELDRGESLAITGESGSGKSTLLHLIGSAGCAGRRPDHPGR